VKFVAFRALIENEIGNPNTNDASSTRIRTLILQWANAVYREIGRRRAWSWLEETENELELDEGESSYDIPATVNKILDLFDLGYTPARQIHIIPESQYWSGQFAAVASGEPEKARIWKGQILFDREAGSDMTLQYRCKLNVSELNTTDNTGLGTEILIPDSDLDVMQDGVRAYWTRYRKGAGDRETQNDFAAYRAKIEELANKDKGPGFFYPASREDYRGPTFRLIVDSD
jgi:hypothetical protein